MRLNPGKIIFALGSWKEIIAPDGEGFWFVFKARWNEHIEIYELHRNIEYGPKDKSGGIIISFLGPYTLSSVNSKGDE